MIYEKHLKELIKCHTLRLQKLQKREAIEGISVDPKVSMEIAEIEAKIDNLQKQIQTEQKTFFAPTYKYPKLILLNFIILAPFIILTYFL